MPQTPRIRGEQDQALSERGVTWVFSFLREEWRRLLQNAMRIHEGDGVRKIGGNSAGFWRGGVRRLFGLVLVLVSARQGRVGWQWAE
jgi:hypothetical protein